MRSMALVLALMASIPALAAQRVSIEMESGPSKTFARLLLANKDKLPLTGDSSVRPGQVRSAECTATALRPERTESALKDAGNAVSCELTLADAVSKRIVLSLADEEVVSWGNFIDKKPFTISGEGVAAALYDILRDATKGPEEDWDPYLDAMDFPGPDGHRIDSAGIKSRPDEIGPNGALDTFPLVLNCVERTQYGELYSRECHFLAPREAPLSPQGVEGPGIQPDVEEPEVEEPGI